MIFPSEGFINKFKSTEGALSVCESIAIINIASEAPNGLYMELGVYKGKSAMSAAAEFKSGNRFILVEPEFSSMAWQEDVYYKVLGVNNTLKVECVAGYSTDQIEKNEDYAYVFVDSGSHQDGLPMQEVKLLEDRIVVGGIIGFHDYLSQFKEVSEAYDYLINTGKFEEIKIDWEEIKKFVSKNNLENNNSSWHHNENPLPCFVGAVRRK